MHKEIWIKNYNLSLPLFHEIQSYDSHNSKCAFLVPKVHMQKLLIRSLKQHQTYMHNNPYNQTPKLVFRSFL